MQTPLVPSCTMGRENRHPSGAAGQADRAGGEVRPHDSRAHRAHVGHIRGDSRQRVAVGRGGRGRGKGRIGVGDVVSAAVAWGGHGQPLCEGSASRGLPGVGRRLTGRVRR